MNHDDLNNAIFQTNNFDRHDSSSLIPVTKYDPDFSYVKPNTHDTGLDPSGVLLDTFHDLIITELSPLGTLKFLIDSKNRISGTENNYTVRLPHVYNIYNIRLIHSNIPRGQYTIDTHTELVFQEIPGVDIVSSIAIGDYTDITDLLNAVTNSMNTASNSSSDYTGSVTNNKIKITSDLIGGQFIIDFGYAGNEYIAEILGFEQRLYSGSGNYTGAFNYNLEPNGIVRLLFTNLDENRYISCEFGDFNVRDNNNRTQELLKNTTRRAETLDISLRNSNNTRYNANGTNHSLYVIIDFMY
jgi:hypothetical protein